MRRVMITLVWGDAGVATHAVSGPNHRAYAERVGAEYVVRHDAPKPGEHRFAPKLRIPPWFADGPWDQLLYSDADVLFGPTAPDLFALAGDRVLAREETCRGFDARPSLRKARMAVRHAAGEAVDDPDAYPYLNAGLYVLPRALARAFGPPPFVLPDHYTAEQEWFALCAQRSGRIRLVPEGDCGVWSTDDRDGFDRLTTVQHFAGHPSRGWAMRAAPLRWREPSPRSPQRAVVVIDSFGMPGLIELHATMIRQLCGRETPIVVSDDHTHEAWEPAVGETAAAGVRRMTRLLDVCARHGLAFRWSGPTPRGPRARELAAFRNGLEYARERDIEYVVKLSQEFLIERPGWLADAVRLLNDWPDRAVLCRPTADGPPFPWAVRTEAIGLRASAWKAPDLVAELTGIPASRLLEGQLAAWLGRPPARGAFAPWPLLPEDRSGVAERVTWEEAPGRDEAPYRRLGERWGVDVSDGLPGRPPRRGRRFVM